MTATRVPKGLVVWITGLPSAGKSTLAARIAAQLRALLTAVLILDGDEVRGALRPVPGYDEAGRDAFYETLARLAALIAAQGYIVLVAATSHRRRFRARARDLAPAFLEVFVDTPLEECMHRDNKGLYEGARSKRITEVPGADIPYEPPEQADFVVHPDNGDAVDLLIARILSEQGGINRSASKDRA